VVFYSGGQFWAKLSIGGKCTDFNFPSENPILNGWEMVVKNTVSSYESSALPLSYSGEKPSGERAGFPPKIQAKISRTLPTPI
jgi:hypothetical protein